MNTDDEKLLNRYNAEDKKMADEVVEWHKQGKDIKVAMLQRRFYIGYNRALLIINKAAKIIDLN